MKPMCAYRAAVYTRGRGSSMPKESWLRRVSENLGGAGGSGTVGARVVGAGVLRRVVLRLDVARALVALVVADAVGLAGVPGRTVAVRRARKGARRLARREAARAGRHDRRQEHHDSQKDHRTPPVAT